MIEANPTVGGELTGASRERSFIAWAGTRAHLTDMFALVDRHMSVLEAVDRDEARATDLASLEASMKAVDELEAAMTEEPPAAAPEGTPLIEAYAIQDAHRNWVAATRTLERERETLERRRAALAATDTELDRIWRARLNLTTNSETLKYSGSAASLASAFDTRVRSRFSLTAPLGYRRPGEISLRLTDESLHLEVNGTSSAWTNAAFAELEGNIARSVPWWRFLRIQWVVWLIWFVTFFVAAWIAVSPHVQDDVTTSVSAWVVVGWASVFIGLLGTVVTKRVVPVFQVLDAGQQATGARAIAILASAAGQILLGILIAALT